MTAALRLIFPLALLAMLAGCMSPAAFNDPVRYGPYYEPKNFHGETHLPATVRRVLLLPVAVGVTAPPESAAAFDESFLTALQRQGRFELVTITRQECWRRYGSSEFPSVAALPHKFLETLSRDFAVDAVLFVDITACRAYRPLALGVRAKLATTEETRLLWAFDEFVSADDPAVANGARRYQLETDRALLPVDVSHAALQSPSRFAAYVADTAFRTLPPR